MVRRFAWASAALFTFLSLALAATTPLQQGNTWSVDFDDPGSDGTQTTTVTIEYTDTHGVKQSKKITATTTITNAMSAMDKKTAVEQKLNAALADPANQVNGQSLATTTGAQDIMLVSPASATGNPPPFTEAKIRKVDTSDKKTGETDKVTRPGGIPAIAIVSALGDITGKAASGPSTFSVITNQGLVSANLSAGMRRSTLLSQLSTGLIAQGATVWIDSDRVLLYVLINGEDITGIGAGTTDGGLAAVTEVIGM